MLQIRSRNRLGFSLFELLVVIAIIGFLVGMLLVAVQKAREAAARISCVNNLKQMGLACHTYHDANENLPSETPKAPGGNAPQSFYIYLLPYVEQQNAIVDKTGTPATKGTPIKLFLCPSRRTVAVGSRRDYGYGGTKAVNTAVLNAPAFTTLAAITNANGTSNTALLTHVWMDPKNYSGNPADPTDKGWASLNNNRDARTDLADTNASGSNTALGGPHPNVNPFLFCDGHVQNIPYPWKPAKGTIAYIWGYDNVAPIDLP